MRREFVERVRTRWFVISTVLGPVLMLALFIVPVLVSVTGASERRVAVLDVSASPFGLRLTADLDRSDPVVAVRVGAELPDLERVADSLTGAVGAASLDGFVIVTDEAVQDGRAEYRGSNVSSIRDMQILTKILEESVLTERLAREGVDVQIVKRAQIPVRLTTAKISGDRKTEESGEGSFILAYIMWFLLYMAILLYGVNVMGSVVEEKTSRVIEVLISSLRPFQLLAGKIVGVGAVGLFQFFIWGICAGLLLKYQSQVIRLLGIKTEALTGAGLTLPHVPIATVVVFLLYFVLGYFLYAAMFAAVAAMSSTESEARQAQMPIVMLLVVPSVLMVGILNDPNGTLAVTLSLIPFCSPIAMPVRWAAAPIPLEQFGASLGILVLSLLVVTWIAARIYRVGILMYGKRPTLRDLVRWVRTA